MITAGHGILLSLAVSHDGHLRQVRWRRWCRYNGSWRGLWDYPNDIPLADAAILIPNRFDRSAEKQGQLADIRRQQNFLRLLLRDFQRDCLSDFRFFFSFAGDLVDRKPLYVLQQNVGIALTLARYVVGDHDDIDEIARQDEAGNAPHVIDPHRHRAFAVL